MKRHIALSGLPLLMEASGMGGIRRSSEMLDLLERLDAVTDRAPKGPPVTNCTAEEARLACEEATLRNRERAGRKG